MFDKIYPPISDTVTRDQFFDNFKRKRPLEPERELMLAVLADAVECYWKYSAARDGIGPRLYPAGCFRAQAAKRQTWRKKRKSVEDAAAQICQTKLERSPQTGCLS